MLKCSKKANWPRFKRELGDFKPPAGTSGGPVVKIPQLLQGVRILNQGTEPTCREARQNDNNNTNND